MPGMLEQEPSYGKPVFLPQGAKIVPLSAPPQEMDFTLAQKDMIRLEKVELRPAGGEIRLGDLEITFPQTPGSGPLKGGRNVRVFFNGKPLACRSFTIRGAVDSIVSVDLEFFPSFPCSQEPGDKK